MKVTTSRNQKVVHGAWRNSPAVPFCGVKHVTPQNLSFVLGLRQDQPLPSWGNPTPPVFSTNQQDCDSENLDELNCETQACVKLFNDHKEVQTQVGHGGLRKDYI